MFSGGGGSVGLDVLGQVLLSVRTVLQSLVVNAPGRKDTANNERRAVDKEKQIGENNNDREAAPNPSTGRRHHTQQQP